jgi:hypothetical protein
MHANQLAVSVETVRAVVDQQFPAWRSLHIRTIASPGTFQQAMGLVWYYIESNPAMSRIGQRTLECIMADRRFSANLVPVRWLQEAYDHGVRRHCLDLAFCCR